MTNRVRSLPIRVAFRRYVRTAALQSGASSLANYALLDPVRVVAGGGLSSISSSLSVWRAAAFSSLYKIWQCESSQSEPALEKCLFYFYLVCVCASANAPGVARCKRGSPDVIMTERAQCVYSRSSCLLRERIIISRSVSGTNRQGREAAGDFSKRILLCTRIFHFQNTRCVRQKPKMNFSVAREKNSGSDVFRNHPSSFTHSGVLILMEYQRERRKSHQSNFALPHRASSSSVRSLNILFWFPMGKAVCSQLVHFFLKTAVNSHNNWIIAKFDEKRVSAPVHANWIYLHQHTSKRNFCPFQLAYIFELIIMIHR